MTGRRVAFWLTVGWLAALPAAIWIDPTEGHGTAQQSPPLWGWWVISTMVMLVLAVVAVGLLVLWEWASEVKGERVPPESLEQRIARRERDLGIGQ